MPVRGVRGSTVDSLSVSVMLCWCVTCTSSLTTQLEKIDDWKEPQPGTQTCGLRSNMKFQPCEPLAIGDKELWPDHVAETLR